jgi:hypothetical protein
MTIDTSNRHAVGYQPHERRIVIVNSRAIDMCGLSPESALNLAAWLVAVADGKATHTFDEIREAIEGG